MITYNTDVRVFLNEDCHKYGVEKIVKAYRLHCKDGIYRQLYKWHQIAIGEKTYTPYKKVAERWADSIRDKNIIEVRCDMVDEY